MSIFGNHVQPNGTIIRAFYCGARLREEAWVEEVVEGRESASWKNWFVSDINSGGKCERHHSLESAMADYDKRVDILINGDQPIIDDPRIAAGERPTGPPDPPKGKYPREFG